MMKFRAFLLAIAALVPVGALAQGVIPTNNPAIFSAQPVQAPSGTTTGTLATRAENRLDLVADFGADPTGATDISGALSAAIAAGRPVFIPAGTFLLSGSVTDPGAEPVNITCSGQATTTINLSGSIAISQTGNFTIPFSIKGCGITFTGSGQISLAGTTYNNSQPLEGPVFQDDYFAVPSGYTGTGPVLGFSYVSSGNFVNTNALINAYGAGILENFVEVSGVSMNWQFVGNQWWNNINGSNTANVSTGLFLNGTTGGGIQGTRISDSEIVGFSKNVFIGPYNNTVQISNSMLDQGYYGIYISGTSINDVRIGNSYIATSAAASSGASAIYAGSAGNLKIYHNTIQPYNTGNYFTDLSTASTTVTFIDNNSAPPYNPNNVPVQEVQLFGPVTATNVLNGQIVVTATTQLTSTAAGKYVFFSGSTAGQTITLPNSTFFPSSASDDGPTIIYIDNNGSVPVNIATVSTDYNSLIGGPKTKGGSFSLQPGQAEVAIAQGNGPGWGSAPQTFFNSIWTTGSATINGIAVGSQPSNPALDLRSATESAGIPALALATGQTIGLDDAGANNAPNTTISSNGTTVAVTGGLSVNGIAVGVTPSVATLGTNPPVSGTAYQWAGPGTLQLACPVTYSPTSTAAATSTLDIGSTSTPSSAVDTESEPAAITAGMVHTAHAEVPAGWYYELSATNATIGTCVGVVH